MEYKCNQCELILISILHKTVDGYSLVVFPINADRNRKSYIPENVAYYLDQANRAKSSGANSAAVAMYRAALEMILFERGYKGMLNEKINAFESYKKSEKASSWARDLDPNHMKITKELGNAAIHPNDGDHKKQSLLDAQLIVNMDALFEHLLYVIYEVENRKNESIKKLQKANEEMKK